MVLGETTLTVVLVLEMELTVDLEEEQAETIQAQTTPVLEVVEHLAKDMTVETDI